MPATVRKRPVESDSTPQRSELRYAPVPDKGDDRQFPRFAFRTLATATIHPVPIFGMVMQECYVLTRDLSRSGISFMHPVRLVNGQKIDLAFEDGREIAVTVCRCQKLAKRCFLIGCKFRG